MAFKRERKYFVLKIRDVRKALPLAEQLTLHELRTKIDKVRDLEGKSPLQAVVVESDWPMYDNVWSQIEKPSSILQFTKLELLLVISMVVTASFGAGGVIGERYGKSKVVTCTSPAPLISPAPN